MKKISALLVIACTGCVTSPSDNIQRPVSFIQNGVRQELGYGINSHKEIRLNKSDFVIETPKVPSDTAIQVCVTEDTNAVEKITKPSSEFSGHCFRSGTGLSELELQNPKDGYHFYVTDGLGHNYYSKDRRVTKDGITKVFIKEVDYEDGVVEKSPTVIVYINSNNDNVMGDRELWSGKIIWE